LRISQYLEGFSKLKCLLIHAGGYSQRTPQHSVCGKIFAPLPVGPLPGSSLLKMCLAMCKRDLIQNKADLVQN
jgi:hypothetical protein